MSYMQQNPQPTPEAPMPNQPAEPQKSMSAMAVAGLVLGIIGVLFSFIPIVNNVAFFLGILGLIFAIVGIVATKGTGKKRGRGLAIAAAVLCVLAMVITVVMQQATSNAIDQAFDTSTTSASAGASSSDGSATASSDESSTASGEMDTEGDLTNVHVKIVSAVKSTADYEGKDTVLVTYEWTNNGDDSTSFAAAVNPQVFQNGVQLDVAIYTENPSGYDPSDELKEIKPGTTQQLSLGYVLTDDSDVSVEVSDLVDFSGTKVTHTYQLS